MNPTYIDILLKEKRWATVLENQKPYPSFGITDNNYCLSLCRSIISQQLSTKAAALIYKRFLDLFKSSKPLPKDIAKATPKSLLKIGLSKTKKDYILNVANFFLNNTSFSSKTPNLTDQEIIDTLTTIKGVGRWTVEMFLIFHLGREDVFSSGDLGIQQAMVKLYKFNAKTTKKELVAKMEKKASCWSPYRSYACLHLWSWKD